MDGEPHLRAESTVFPGASATVMEREVVALQSPWHIRAITGERAILGRHAQLRALAERCGQLGELDQLAWYLAAARIRAKRPHLLLFEQAGKQAFAAVLLLEYFAGFLPLRLVFSLDFTGQRTVIAPPHLRSPVAGAAARHLLRQGALLALVSVEGHGFPGALDPPSSYRAAVLERPIRQLWRLREDLDTTLAGMGKHTRRNFRLSLRTLEADSKAAFVPEVSTTEAEFLRLNSDCAYPTSRSIARWRFRAVADFAETRLAGIRSSDGRWLSLVGLRTRDWLTDVDWQMNLADANGISLVTAMRAFLLRDELERGTRFLRFDGGTSHPMQSGFEEQVVSHLLLTHRSVTPWFLRKLITQLFAPDNLLRNVVCATELQWAKPDRE